MGRLGSPDYLHCHRTRPLTIKQSELEASHTPKAVRERLAGQKNAENYLSDFIYGAIDGTVTTFAIVAGVAGAGLNEGIIILLGLANLVADGFSMAASNFLGTRANAQAREKIRRQEEDHVDSYPEGEREEIRQIFAEKGFSGEALEGIVDVITADRNRWIETMLREEHGFSSTEPSAWKAAGITFVAFLLIGAIPLVSYLVDWMVPGLIGAPFFWSCVLTGLAFLIVGAMKSLFALQHWCVSAFETLVLGGIAASIAYFIGESLKGFAS